MHWESGNVFLVRELSQQEIVPKVWARRKDYINKYKYRRKYKDKYKYEIQMRIKIPALHGANSLLTASTVVPCDVPPAGAFLNKKSESDVPPAQKVKVKIF